MGAIPLEKGIEYPISDGQPMAESSHHQTVMFDMIYGLKSRYAKVPDVWVGGNLFLCYEEGNPAAVVAPDVLVARGVTKWERPNYLLWEEVPPSLIIEVTSRTTRREDLGKKKSIYERIEAEEYILFDPYGEYLKPRLQGDLLTDGRYQPIPRGPDGSLESRTLGVKLLLEGDRLRIIDTATGKRLLWPDEVAEVYAEAEARAARAEERVRALEEELRRLRGEER
ncbi:MAG TPA: Uma2 family endonuclease [Thermoanaerobaculia bacterium]|nr:Uma2 family endonuclease [Thermoanaerobaculia bacterium]